jgi:hypothetical protein
MKIDVTSIKEMLNIPDSDIVRIISEKEYLERKKAESETRVKCMVQDCDTSRDMITKLRTELEKEKQKRKSQKKKYRKKLLEQKNTYMIENMGLKLQRYEQKTQKAENNLIYLVEKLDNA